MTPEERTLAGILIVNLPLLMGFFLALQRKWLHTGESVTTLIATMTESHMRETEQKDKEIEFREQLRQEGITDKKAVEERLIKFPEALKELADVVKQSLDFSERLVGEPERETRPRTRGRTRSDK